MRQLYDSVASARYVMFKRQEIVRPPSRAPTRSVPDTHYPKVAVMKQMLRLVGTAVALALPFAAQGQVLKFEGIAPQTPFGFPTNTAPIGNYYNGGAGPNYGITFSSLALAVCLNTATLQTCSGSSRGDRGDPTSQTGGLTLGSSMNQFMNRSAGFTTGFSFYYAAPFEAGTFNVWSGLDGTGALLATRALPATPIGPEPCYNAPFCPFVATSVTFSGTAHSVTFVDGAEELGIDDITFTVPTDGQVVPEPASMVLLATGLVGVFGAARRRRKSA